MPTPSYQYAKRPSSMGRFLALGLLLLIVLAGAVGTFWFLNTKSTDSRSQAAAAREFYVELSPLSSIGTKRTFLITLVGAASTPKAKITSYSMTLGDTPLPSPVASYRPTPVPSPLPPQPTSYPPRPTAYPQPTAIPQPQPTSYPRPTMIPAVKKSYLPWVSQVQAAQPLSTPIPSPKPPQPTVYPSVKPSPPFPSPAPPSPSPVPERVVMSQRGVVVTSIGNSGFSTESVTMSPDNMFAVIIAGKQTDPNLALVGSRVIGKIEIDKAYLPTVNPMVRAQSIKGMLLNPPGPIIELSNLMPGPTPVPSPSLRPTPVPSPVPSMKPPVPSPVPSPITTTCKTGVNTVGLSQPCGINPGYYRSFSYQCHDGTSGREGGSSTCMPASYWNNLAATRCQGRMSPSCVPQASAMPGGRTPTAIPTPQKR